MSDFDFDELDRKVKQFGGDIPIVDEKVIVKETPRVDSNSTTPSIVKVEKQDTARNVSKIETVEKVKETTKLAPKPTEPKVERSAAKPEKSRLPKNTERKVESIERRDTARNPGEVVRVRVAPAVVPIEPAAPKKIPVTFESEDQMSEVAERSVIQKIHPVEAENSTIEEVAPLVAEDSVKHINQIIEKPEEIIQPVEELASYDAATNHLEELAVLEPDVGQVNVANDEELMSSVEDTSMKDVSNVEQYDEDINVEEISDESIAINQNAVNDLIGEAPLQAPEVSGTSAALAKALDKQPLTDEEEKLFDPDNSPETAPESSIGRSSRLWDILYYLLVFLLVVTIVVLIFILLVRFDVIKDVNLPFGLSDS